MSVLKNMYNNVKFLVPSINSPYLMVTTLFHFEEPLFTDSLCDLSGTDSIFWPLDRPIITH